MLNHLMANILAWLYTMGFDSVSIHALFWICVIGVPLVIVLCATGHDGSKDKPRRKTR
jgi:hypothetical protein